MNISKQTKRLIAFDFDHTIANDNTDIVVRDLIDSTLITDNIKALYNKDGWISYMQEIFKLLFQNGIKQNEIIEAIKQIPPVLGIRECIETLHKNNFDIIIISDSNSEFINFWNCTNDISKFITNVYTNLSKFNVDGLLELKPFHHQIDCRLSSENLCKGKILEDYIEKMSQQNINYKNIFFVGDGKNDICPMLRLKEFDFACPRKEYFCDKNLERVGNKSNNLKASILRWENGEELLENILKVIEGDNKSTV